MMMRLLCVCDEEWCFCDVLLDIDVPENGRVPDIACDECKAGHHVWELGGERS